MNKNTHTSTWARQVGKMSGIDKKILRLYNSLGKAILKKSDNAKRRRYLKNNYE